MYAKWIAAREERAHRRDNNRIVRSFDWGLEYLGLRPDDPDPARAVRGHAAEAFADSGRFYCLPTPPDFHLEGDLLSYRSAVATPSLENNTVCARYFRRPGAAAAVVVLPQWNANARSHMGLCRLLNRCGFSALRLTLPYHETRKPPELQRADYMVDSNVGRTIQSCRQAVLDARLAVEWLSGRGYRRLAILGTSLGACIAFLTFAHEPRLQAAIFNHASSHFADVVWEGMTTRHIRQGLQGHVTLDDLRECWKAISPLPFVQILPRNGRRRSLVISARYDPTFLPRLTRLLFDEYARCGVPFERVTLPCGHYTLAEFPFSWIDAYHMARFLRRQLLR